MKTSVWRWIELAAMFVAMRIWLACQPPHVRRAMKAFWGQE